MVFLGEEGLVRVKYVTLPAVSALLDTGPFILLTIWVVPLLHTSTIIDAEEYSGPKRAGAWEPRNFYYLPATKLDIHACDVFMRCGLLLGVGIFLLGCVKDGVMSRFLLRASWSYSGYMNLKSGLRWIQFPIGLACLRHR